jgi:hypothetical protein
MSSVGSLNSFTRSEDRWPPLEACSPSGNVGCTGKRVSVRGVKAPKRRKHSGGGIKQTLVMLSGRRLVGALGRP